LPHASLRTAQLIALIDACVVAPTRHAAWSSIVGIAISLTSAYRWIKKWLHAAHHIRTWLHTISVPPSKTDQQHDHFSLRHLRAAFPACPCAAAAYQERFQLPICASHS
jgi:hypothetical protein